MSVAMNNIASAVLWPISIILNMVVTLPPIGVVLSTIVSFLAIIHYIMEIRKAFRERRKEKKNE